MGVAIVTGAGSGIGAATARALAARGDHVVCADIVKDAAATTAQGLTGAIAVRVDVSDASSCDEMVQQAVTHFGAVDAIATCAGIEKHGSGEDFDEADFDRIIDVNLKGTGCAPARSRGTSSPPAARTVGHGILSARWWQPRRSGPARPRAGV
jgi:NAD(P)-dependent dehydrogenase (short-subunit alcohol dehydrogenase family)